MSTLKIIASIIGLVLVMIRGLFTLIGALFLFFVACMAIAAWTGVREGTRSVVRCACRLRYGVRGALKPPISPTCFYEEASLIQRTWYGWRCFVWGIDSKLYTFSKLPVQWDKHMRGRF